MATQYWEKVSAPVLQILDEPRDWAFMDKWAQQKRFGRSRFRQVLAWLEDQHKATSFTRKEGRKTRVYWVNIEWVEAHEQLLKS